MFNSHLNAAQHDGDEKLKISKFKCGPTMKTFSSLILSLYAQSSCPLVKTQQNSNYWRTVDQVELFFYMYMFRDEELGLKCENKCEIDQLECISKCENSDVTCLSDCNRESIDCSSCKFPIIP